MIAQNNRFLTLPHIKVPHLASKLLSLNIKQIRQDWFKYYRHPLYLLETFVDQSRFKGTSYRAANWIYVEQTKGFTKKRKCLPLSRHHQGCLPLPLGQRFQEVPAQAMKNLFPFHLGKVIKKLNKIRIATNLRYQQPFPKSKERLLSHYSFVPRRIKIKPSGEIQGGLSRFVTSLIDFSSVRSIAAGAYSSIGGHVYDPVSLFLLQLFQYLEKFPDLKDFLSIV